MSISEQRAAEELAVAVAKHLKSSAVERQCGYKLIGVYKEVKKATATSQIAAPDLDHIRRSLCFTCRGHDLYHCDVAKGWSPKCTFIQRNT
jgi:hypothetical protein